MNNPASPHKKAHGGRLKPYGVKKHLTTKDNWPLDEQAAAYILLFGDSLGFYGRMVYQGHTITAKDEGWLLTVRARDKGKNVVSFSFGDTQQDAIRDWALHLVHDQLTWRPDRFKP